VQLGATAVLCFTVTAVDGINILFVVHRFNLKVEFQQLNFSFRLIRIAKVMIKCNLTID
jgi:hypothetical protein